MITDMDVACMYGTLIKPLKIKEPKMTIETGKTYKLAEPVIKTNALVSGYHTLSLVFGDSEFEIISFDKSKWFEKAYRLSARRLDNGKVEDTMVYAQELEMFKEVCKDPTDLLCKAVSIRRVFDNPICGWVSDQWVENGVELLNVVHAGSFSVVPRSAVKLIQ
jgi:hypothetical protein